MSERQDEYWMRRALALAEQASAIGEVPVGAVIVRDGELLGEGWNCPISSHDPTAHAEVVAIRSAAVKANNYRLPGATLYVTIEPCAMCAGAMVHARIAEVVFAATEPKAGVVCSNLHLFEQAHLNHRVESRQGVLSEEATQLMQQFFKRRRKEAKAARLVDGAEGAKG